MTEKLQPYEVYAIRYARHDQRRTSENFIGGAPDPHDDPLMPLDFFVWAIRGPNGTFVVDSGFDEAMAARRQRKILCPVGEGLRKIGIDPATVENVLITHLHYDHAGNNDLFPNARYHLQDKEMQYSTGRCMCHAPMRHAYAVEDVTSMVRKVFDGRVQFHDGVSEIAPGITVHHVGGHTMGLQVVRVWTRRGWMVLASDASHYYANMEQSRPFPIVYNVADMLEGHRFVHRLASASANVIPGHDPLVLERYAPPREDLKGIVARLDAEPRF
jgi:glyoxylase-like metal-dependent hydrolase (beta-lactamase superfamily II)